MKDCHTVVLSFSLTRLTVAVEMAHLKLFEAKMKAQYISHTPPLVDVCQKI